VKIMHLFFINQQKESGFEVVNVKSCEAPDVFLIDVDS